MSITKMFHCFASSFPTSARSNRGDGAGSAPSISVHWPAPSSARGILDYCPSSTTGARRSANDVVVAAVAARAAETEIAAQIVAQIVAQIALAGASRNEHPSEPRHAKSQRQGLVGLHA
jgi:hypothetical protein